MSEVFSDDFIRLVFKDGSSLDFLCVDLGLPWPPPEFINKLGWNFKRVSYSQLTTEGRRMMEGNTTRGAEYHAFNPATIQ